MTQAQKILPDPDRKYRLITRSDFDGLVCGVLLKSLGIIDDVTFAHPKDMQDGIIDVSKNDITTNLPYAEGVYLAIDHHASELERIEGAPINHIVNPDAPSAARVVYEYFGGKDSFPHISEDIMTAVDKADSAQFTRDEILDPSGWVLLNFLMDSRTGLGRFRDFNISNYQLMMLLMEQCAQNKTVDELLALPDVKERVDLYFEQQTKAKEQIERCSEIYKHLVVFDTRQEDHIWATNRFMIYALFPQTSISMHVLWGKNKQNTVFAIGKSILNKTSQTHIGKLCLEYGGGGHKAAGTCQVSNLKADEIKEDLIAKIRKDG